MSLNYDLSEIEDFKNVCFDDEENISAITETLIFYCLALEVPRLTECTLEEFWVRMQIHDRLVGPLAREYDKHDGGPKDRPITYPELEAHLGLKTNASKKAWGKWIGGLAEQSRVRILDELEYESRKEQSQCA